MREREVFWLGTLHVARTMIFPPFRCSEAFTFDLRCQIGLLSDKIDLFSFRLSHFEENEMKSSRNVFTLHPKLLHLFQDVGNAKISVRACSNIFACGVWGDLHEYELILDNIKNTQFCDDAVYSLFTSQWKRALVEDSVTAILCVVVHSNNDASFTTTADEIHRSSHSFHHFAGNDPVGKIAIRGDL